MISQKALILLFKTIPNLKEGTLGYLVVYLTPQVHFARFLQSFTRNDRSLFNPHLTLDRSLFNPRLSLVQS